jgi:hypothetical protein
LFTREYRCGEGCADGVDSHDISFVSYDEWRKTLNDGMLEHLIYGIFAEV